MTEKEEQLRQRDNRAAYMRTDSEQQEDLHHTPAHRLFPVAEPAVAAACHSKSPSSPSDFPALELEEQRVPASLRAHIGNRPTCTSAWC